MLARSVGEHAVIYLYEPTTAEYRPVTACSGEPQVRAALQAMPPATTADVPVLAEVMHTGEPSASLMSTASTSGHTSWNSPRSRA